MRYTGWCHSVSVLVADASLFCHAVHCLQHKPGQPQVPRSRQVPLLLGRATTQPNQKSCPLLRKKERKRKGKNKRTSRPTLSLFSLSGGMHRRTAVHHLRGPWRALPCTLSVLRSAPCPPSSAPLLARATHRTTAPPPSQNPTLPQEPNKP